MGEWCKERQQRVYSRKVCEVRCPKWKKDKDGNYYCDFKGAIEKLLRKHYG